MPEKDDWKDSFKVTNDPQTHHAYPCHITKFQMECIDDLLSSQSHALKERMKACVPEKQPIVFDGSSSAKFGKGFESQGFNDCREQVLQALGEI